MRHAPQPTIFRNTTNAPGARAWILSVVVHGALLLLIIVGFSWRHKAIVPEPQPIAVELVTIAETTQMKHHTKYHKPEKGKSKVFDAPPIPKSDPAPPVDKPKPEPKPEPKPQPAPASKPEPMPEAVPLKPKPTDKKHEQEKKPDPAPQEQPPQPTPVVQPKVKPKTKPREEPKPAPIPAPDLKAKPKDKAPSPSPSKKDTFSDVLKAVSDLRQKDLDVEKDDTAKHLPQTTPSQDHKNLTISEMDALRRQLAGCWTPPIGIQNPEEIVVELDLTVNPDATVHRVEVVDQGRTLRDMAFRAAADAAVRAVKHPSCTPLLLPNGKYDLWKSFRLLFNPSQMF